MHPATITTKAIEVCKTHSQDSIYWACVAAKILYLRELNAYGALIGFPQRKEIEARDKLIIENFIAREEGRQKTKQDVNSTKETPKETQESTPCDNKMQIEEARRKTVLLYQLKKARELQEATGLGQNTGSSSHETPKNDPSDDGDNGDRHRPAHNPNTTDPLIHGPMYSHPGWDDETTLAGASPLALRSY